MFNDALYHLQQTPNVVAWPVEIAFGDRPFEVTSQDNPHHIRLRTKTVLWHKETSINIGISRLPAGWQYAGYLDGDFHMTRHDWALEAIHQLQHYSWVQPYSSYSPLSPENIPMDVRPGYAYVYRDYSVQSPNIPPSELNSPSAMGAPTSVASGGIRASAVAVKPQDRAATKARKLIEPGATGGGWTFTNAGFNAVGGLLDTCIMGSADWHMAFGLTGESVVVGESQCTKEYLATIERWKTRASSVIHGNIGYVEQFATHPWHGAFKNRGYGTRWQLQRDFKFDPNVDLVRDWQGLWQWAGNKPVFESAVTRYFISRNEDSTENDRGAIV